jgi:phosphoglycolate phosphatase
MVRRAELFPEAPFTVVLDLDGTIADTAADLIDAANAALISEGFEKVPAHAIKAGVGYGTKAMLRLALQFLGVAASPGQMERMRDALVLHYENNIAVETRLFPGFVEAAMALRGRGAKLALCTNKLERLTVSLLSKLHIADLFDAIACGDSFSFRKPDPRHITELVQMTGGSLRAALMIGDSEADVGAARAAGIPVAVTSFGYAATPAHDLGADAVIAHFDELPGLVFSLLTRSEAS